MSGLNESLNDLAMLVGLATDHAGFALKESLAKSIHDLGHEVKDFGANVPDPHDDYPDFVAPLAEAVARGDIARGVAVCGSGVGASIVANKIPGLRAGVCHDTYSARQGVQHDAMNVLALGARVIGPELACEVVRAFLGATFRPEERHVRRLKKLRALESRHPE